MGIDYSQLTVAELNELLDERGIDYLSSDLKADKIGLLEEDDANGL